MLVKFEKKTHLKTSWLCFLTIVRNIYGSIIKLDSFRMPDVNSSKEIKCLVFAICTPVPRCRKQIVCNEPHNTIPKVVPSNLRVRENRSKECKIQNVTNTRTHTRIQKLGTLCTLTPNPLCKTTSCFTFLNALCRKHITRDSSGAARKMLSNKADPISPRWVRTCRNSDDGTCTHYKNVILPLC